MSMEKEHRDTISGSVIDAPLLAALPVSQAGQPVAPFQKRVLTWLMECFSMEICRDGQERNHRFLEEALELVQSLDCTRSEAHQLVDYVFDRPPGDPDQELGGTQVTLAALCFPHDLDMDAARERELARVWTKIDKIREKQAAKPKHSPLPAAPQSVGVQPVEETDKRYWEFREKVEALVFDPIRRGGRVEAEILAQLERMSQRDAEALRAPGVQPVAEIDADNRREDNAAEVALRRPGWRQPKPIPYATIQSYSDFPEPILSNFLDLEIFMGDVDGEDIDVEDAVGTFNAIINAVRAALANGQPTLTDEHIERAAKAIQQVWQGNHAHSRPWNNGTEKDCVHGLPGQAEFFRTIARAALASGQSTSGVRKAHLHPATAKLVEDFATALATKLRSAEVKYGYSTGWRDDYWQKECRMGLMAHVIKGDALDVAAYAAFCWARKWSTAPWYPDHEEAFLPLFERWADAMLIGDPDREILRKAVHRALAAAPPARSEETTG